MMCYNIIGQEKKGFLLKRKRIPKSCRTLELFFRSFINSCNFKQFSCKVKRDPIFKELNFISLSVQSVPKRLYNFLDLNFLISEFSCNYKILNFNLYF